MVGYACVDNLILNNQVLLDSFLSPTLTLFMHNESILIMKNHYT